MAKLILPGGRTVQGVIDEVVQTQGDAYRRAVATACAYLDGHWRADTEAWIRRVFPNTADAIEAVGLKVLLPISEEKSTEFDGSPALPLIDKASGEEVAETPSGVQWADVLDEGALWPTLGRLGTRTVPARLAFVRVLWDAVDERLRLDLFDADKVFPLYDPDRPDIATAPIVLLELAPIYRDEKAVRRFEVWTAVRAPDGKTLTAEFCIVDETSEILSGPFPNPYTGPDGLQGLERASYPVIPIVGIGDVSTTPWPFPDQALIDAQRSINVEASNRLYCLLTQAHGQWVARQTVQNADAWNGAPAARDYGSILSSGRRAAEDTGQASLAFGPAEVVRAPYGWALDHVVQGAQLTALSEALEADLRHICVLNGVPSRTLVASAQVASGASMLVEREPLARYRRERIAAFSRTVGRLGDLCRIVWNTHHDDTSQRFLSAGGLRAKFRPDHLRPILDPTEAADLAQKLKATGLYSDAEVMSRVDGITVAEAAALLEASAGERTASAERRTGIVSRVFASPLAQARGKPAAPVEDEGNEPEDDEPAA